MRILQANALAAGTTTVDVCNGSTCPQACQAAKQSGRAALIALRWLALQEARQNRIAVLSRTHASFCCLANAVTESPDT